MADKHNTSLPTAGVGLSPNDRAPAENPLEIFKREFLSCLDASQSSLAFESFTGSSDAFALIALASCRLDRPVLAVTPGIPDAERLASDLDVLRHFAPQVRILEFPARQEGEVSTIARRLKTLSALQSYSLLPYPAIIVAPAIALEDVDIPFDGNLPDIPSIRAGAGLSLGGLAGELQKAGYTRVPEVSSPGEYAIRGGIVDFWSADAEDAVRVEYFGDEIESIRAFNAATQLSTGPLEEASIAPCSYGERGTGNGERETVNRQDQTIIQSENRTIFDILPSGTLIFLFEYNEYMPAGAPQAAKPGELSDSTIPRFHDFSVFYSGEPAPEGVRLAAFRAASLPGLALFSRSKTPSPQILEERRAALARHLNRARANGKTVIDNLKLSGSFETGNLVVSVKSDRGFSRFASRRRRKKVPSSGERLKENSVIEIGEKVVHVEHGIGRYLGTEEISTSRGRSEVFAIEYAGGAKLYVPVTSAHLLSRYVGVRGAEAKLDELDSKRWRKTKERAEQNVRDLAASLLEVQARRAAMPGFAYKTDLPEIAAFEEAFPYEETPDQAAAIADVKRDMAAPSPMDRLICGDAGYGKTEVAMRAAYIAAINGRQTVLLAPTTILAEQHYETFLDRFDETGVAIETMSRFQSPEAHRETIKRLAAGTIDIVIGTHAILSENVAFKNLGLVIIDEEQRFGVRHKEHLKRLRTEADVLAISATPIPRTLYLSMTGARDLSQLRTAPRERTAVETIIRRDSDEAIREALRRELARGGQAYYIFNRVRGIEDAAKRIKSIVPKARIEVAHAQLPTAELAARMAAFAQGRADILVSTTIVESGLDIPRANTIIVDRADRFGLAELYQIRGRVGRSSRQGYAYLLLPGEGLVDSEARERLGALKRHQGLGAGFDIALRDLELRGAGNLLGREQSGHIAAVGFQLYCQLLRRAVDRLKNGKGGDVVDVSLNLDFIDLGPGTVNNDSGATLPYEYIEEDPVRLSIYRRLAECRSTLEVRRLGAELRDRFGKMPLPVKRLVKLTELRISAARRGIARIDSVNGKTTIYKTASPEPAKIATLASSTTDGRIAELFKMIV